MILLIPALAYIFWSDLKRHIIPNNVVLILSVAAIALSVYESKLLECLVGGLIGFSAMLIIKVLAPKGVGTGDVKLSGAIGLMTGYYAWVAFVLSWVVAAVVVAVIQSKRDIKEKMFPFGCALCVAGAVIVVAF